MSREIHADDISPAKDAKAFDKLVNSLRVRKWQRENPTKHRAKGLRWRAAHREQANAAARKSQHAKVERDRRCERCAEAFVKPVGRAGPRRYCGDECARLATNERERARQVVTRRNSGRVETSCGACQQPGHNRRTCPDLVIEANLPSARTEAA